jgi:7-cyano-7-deazaguanine synthase
MQAHHPAIVLLSGGLDSSTVLAMALAQGFEPHALSFRYGQRHLHEIEAARRIARHAGVAGHRVVDVDLGQFGGSALTTDVEVPKDRDEAAIGGGIPITYVPARNTIFLSYALAWAEVLPAHDIFIGVNAVDYSGYPDCRPEFIEAFETVANLATREGTEGRRIRVHAPLAQMSKAEIVHRGLELDVDYGMTRSCYDPSPEGKACGHCDACLLRLKAFSSLGMEDPAPYVVP